MYVSCNKQYHMVHCMLYAVSAALALETAVGPDLVVWALRDAD